MSARRTSRRRVQETLGPELIGLSAGHRAPRDAKRKSDGSYDMDDFFSDRSEPVDDLEDSQDLPSPVSTAPPSTRATLGKKGPISRVTSTPAVSSPLSRQGNKTPQSLHKPSPAMSSIKRSSKRTSLAPGTPMTPEVPPPDFDDAPTPGAQTPVQAIDFDGGDATPTNASHQSAAAEASPAPAESSQTDNAEEEGATAPSAAKASAKRAPRARGMDINVMNILEPHAEGRPQRKRIPPTRFWKGEKPIYVPRTLDQLGPPPLPCRFMASMTLCWLTRPNPLTNIAIATSFLLSTDADEVDGHRTGTMTIADVLTKPTPAVEHKRMRRTKRKLTKAEKMAAGSRTPVVTPKRPRGELNPMDVRVLESPEIPVIDYTSDKPDETVPLKVAMTYAMQQWASTPKNPGLKYSKNFQDRTCGWSSGMLELDFGASKGEVSSTNNFMLFSVLSGVVQATVNESKITLGPGGTFFVPPNNKYGLINQSDDCKVILSFASVQLKR
ncbi:uncharacterized protein MONBRDRAFT_39193 [Monosiga brevicollis MX1]|uniref:Mif2/CENP-C cupin domain-containing protein n=1 Tax=Monosiga brevicollis TaxID=81824 RepID=A9VCU0_MONBE|nr:uncharacterized protein MONBRDRAFT_39193 [Monosiga brevicollis MX1]EDQ84625.1 predicted protein [Monosiga brevicollis MX1]|eukprot:XP_001750529.1 hypothetical protein [Monosiga brevicollis MX1]